MHFNRDAGPRNGLQRGLRTLHRDTSQHSDLTGHAEVAEAVGAVAGDFEVNGKVASPGSIDSRFIPDSASRSASPPRGRGLDVILKPLQLTIMNATCGTSQGQGRGHCIGCDGDGKQAGNRVLSAGGEVFLNRRSFPPVLLGTRNRDSYTPRRGS